jgi:hypothetical protein
MLSLQELEAAHSALRDIARRRGTLTSRYDVFTDQQRRDEEIEAIVSAVDRERERKSRAEVAAARVTFQR